MSLYLLGPEQEYALCKAYRQKARALFSKFPPKTLFSVVLHGKLDNYPVTKHTILRQISD